MNAGQKIEIPVMVVTSNADQAIQLGVIPRLMANLPNGQWLQLTGQPHTAMVYNPDYVAHYTYSVEGIDHLPFGSLSEANTQYDYMIGKIKGMFNCGDLLDTRAAR
jgi:hypothetical protein